MEFGTMCPTDAFGAGHTQPSLGFSAADQRAQIIPCTVGVIGTTRGAAAVLPLVTCNAPNFPALPTHFPIAAETPRQGEVHSLTAMWRNFSVVLVPWLSIS